MANDIYMEIKAQQSSLPHHRHTPMLTRPPNSLDPNTRARPVHLKSTPQYPGVLQTRHPTPDVSGRYITEFYLRRATIGSVGSLFRLGAVKRRTIPASKSDAALKCPLIGKEGSPFVFKLEHTLFIRDYPESLSPRRIFTNN